MIGLKTVETRFRVPFGGHPMDSLWILGPGSRSGIRPLLLLLADGTSLSGVFELDLDQLVMPTRHARCELDIDWRIPQLHDGQTLPDVVHHVRLGGMT